MMRKLLLAAAITLVAGARGDVFDTFSGAFRIVP